VKWNRNVARMYQYQEMIERSSEVVDHHALEDGKKTTITETTRIRYARDMTSNMQFDY
jgi:hypothetical protein